MKQLIFNGIIATVITANVSMVFYDHDQQIKIEVKQDLLREKIADHASLQKEIIKEAKEVREAIVKIKSDISAINKTLERINKKLDIVYTIKK